MHLLLQIAMRLALLLLPQPHRLPKPSPRPAGTLAIHSGNVTYEPTDDDCANDCHTVSDRFEDDCLELCSEEK